MGRVKDFISYLTGKKEQITKGGKKRKRYSGKRIERKIRDLKEGRNQERR